MPDISQLVEGAIRNTGRIDGGSSYQGIITTTPADPQERVMVNIPSLDPSGQLEWGPCPWSPRIHDASNFAMPSAGDLALVLMTEEGEPWIVEWWPYGE